MRRVARVTECLGSGDAGFYVQEPEIPEGLTCQEWRVRRFDARSAEQGARTARRRRTLLRPKLRPGLA
jgi:hypothetical protein